MKTYSALAMVSSLINLVYFYERYSYRMYRMWIYTKSDDDDANSDTLFKHIENRKLPYKAKVQ